MLAWRRQVNGDFNKFVTEIDWNKGAGRSGDTGILRRWLPVGAKGNEFIYDLKKAKKVLDACCHVLAVRVCGVPACILCPQVASTPPFT